MYFTSRTAAGEKLAKILAGACEKGADYAVVALSDGAVKVGAPIAKKLNAPLSVLVSSPVRLPTVGNEVLGSVGQDGAFIVGDQYTARESQELAQEYRGYLEEEKIRQLHHINKLLDDKGVVALSGLRGKNVVAVSDGLEGVSTLDALASFIKPIHITGLIAAVPIATVKAVDKMHIMFDSLYCLSVIENYITTDHYYNDEAPPSHEEALKLISKLSN